MAVSATALSGVELPLIAVRSVQRTETDHAAASNGGGAVGSIAAAIQPAANLSYGNSSTKMSAPAVQAALFSFRMGG
jgi:hypothetical protein